MKEESYIQEYLIEAGRVFQSIPVETVAEVIRALAAAREKGAQIFTCGNGGSAATASHMANDLGKGASLIPVNSRFKVHSLVDNLSWITALANDLDYSEIFVEQIRNFARPGDILIAFSGSGNSANVIKAVEYANENGLTTIGLTGIPGGKLLKLAQIPVQAQTPHMGRIEDTHFLIQHLIGYFFMEQ
jgi:D-sedoheptulose 7-phosphate isomerase